MSKLTIKENLEKYRGIDSCPVRNVIAKFSGKWSFLILCILAENESTRFKEICSALPDISSKVLTDTLKNLEASGLVHRQSYAEVPPRVEYSLTELGRSLMPHLNSLINWALDHFNQISSR